MGITVQPTQPAPAADDGSSGDSSPSRSGSPAREAATSAAPAREQAQKSPADAFAAAAALPKQQAVLSSHRVSMLRGGPLAGAYIDGRYTVLLSSMHPYASSDVSSLLRHVVGPMLQSDGWGVSSSCVERNLSGI